MASCGGDPSINVVRSASYHCNRARCRAAGHRTSRRNLTCGHKLDDRRTREGDGATRDVEVGGTKTRLHRAWTCVPSIAVDVYRRSKPRAGAATSKEVLGERRSPLGSRSAHRCFLRSRTQPQKPLAPPPPVVLLKLPEKATCQLAAPYALAAGEPMTVIPAVKTEATATTNHRRIPFALTPPSCT